MMCASVCIKSHRPMHVMEFRDSPESNPPKCRVVTERTDSNKKLWLCYDKRGFPKDFKWDEIRVISFVRELTVTKNKRELLEKNKYINGFPTHWNNLWHKMKFGNFLLQNKKICELVKDDDKSDKFFVRFRVSFDHLNQNLISVNKELMKSKRPIAEVIIVVETQNHICVSSLFFKHFTGKGPMNRQGQALFDTYDCTSFLFNKASRSNKVTFATFEKGIERYKGNTAQEYSFFQSKLDHSKFDDAHQPSRHTPVVFGGGNAASAASRKRAREMKELAEKNGETPAGGVESTQIPAIPPLPSLPEVPAVEVPSVSSEDGNVPVVPTVPHVIDVPSSTIPGEVPLIATNNEQEQNPEADQMEKVPELVSTLQIPSMQVPSTTEESLLINSESNNENITGNKRKIDEVLGNETTHELEPPQKKQKLN